MTRKVLVIVHLHRIWSQICFTENDGIYNNFHERKNFYLLYYTHMSSKQVSHTQTFFIWKLTENVTEHNFSVLRNWYNDTIMMGSILVRFPQQDDTRRTTDLTVNYYLHVNTQLAMNIVIFPIPNQSVYSVTPVGQSVILSHTCPRTKRLPTST